MDKPRDQTQSLWPIIVAAAMLSSSTISAGAAEKGDLDHCISLKTKIDKYTSLRRGGGSAQQMDRWRDAQRRHESEFTDLRCRRFGRKLRVGS